VTGWLGVWFFFLLLATDIHENTDKLFEKKGNAND
jgi:hypothetical protein